jgi:hypothetical protein
MSDVDQHHADAPGGGAFPERDRSTGGPLPGPWVPDTVATDRALLRVGAVTGSVGVLVQIAMDQLHPAQADPNQSQAAFAEYARSRIWTEVHLGQFFGTLLLAVSLLCLARALSRQRGLPGALAVVAAFTTVLLTAVFTVQMALDGIALRTAVHAWTTATGPQKASAFQVAEGLRGLEKGLSALFHINNGLTLLTLGLSIAFGRLYASALGWTAVLAGGAFVAGGVVTAHAGFSSGAGLLLKPALLLLVVFMVGICVSMWRRGNGRVGRRSSQRDVAAGPASAAEALTR